MGRDLNIIDDVAGDRELVIARLLLRQLRTVLSFTRKHLPNRAEVHSSPEIFFTALPINAQVFLLTVLFPRLVSSPR